MDHLAKIKFTSPIVSTTVLDGYGSTNYKVELENTEIYLVKIYPNSFKKHVLEQTRIITLLQKNLEIALPVAIEIPIEENANEKVHISVSKFISGQCLQSQNITTELLQHIGKTAGTICSALKYVESDIIKAHQHDWNLRDALSNKPKIKYLTDANDKKIVNHYFDVFAKYTISEAWLHLPQSIIHGDLNESNIIIEQGKLNGIIDFGDISFAPTVAELAILLTYIMMMFPDNGLEKASIIIAAFAEKYPLSEAEIEALPLFIAIRLCVSVCNSAQQKAANTDTAYILVSEQPAWHLLRKWITYNPIYLTNEFKKYAGFATKEVDSNQIFERRHITSSPSLSLSYSKPIHMSSALFQYMFDAHGGTYLDAYNNIPHIGHSHPAIRLASSQQTDLLNTNTRYLYNSYINYTENLLTLFPAPLQKVMLVNSGSEASDLACRVARTISGREGIAVLQWSYHGNTQNGINISSYKFDRKGGMGAKSTILRLQIPKAYKGTHDSAAAYVTEAIEMIDAFEITNHKLAALIVESISGCGGQVPLMDNYLQLLHAALKQRGILLIVDEVQTGFGRLGNWFWGFEMLGVVPDMVVIGKPMGNGHPMGGVITTNAITDAFCNGMEFFSSFGGNPVSCAIGNAVINTIKEEGLQQNAALVGKYWKQQLVKLQKDFPLLGDVRGEGLFIGVECITEAGTENTELASHIKNQMKEAYILCSTDGPLDNTLKMKPPLCITTDNVDFFIHTMKDILQKTI
jgi:ethanolamine-phosphate phospho-lyase